MKDFIISPPFGRYFSHPKATSVKGSYTWERRKGLVINTLKSFRPTKDGWVNKIGLRNCGLQNVIFNNKNIYSIAGIHDNDWMKMISIIPERSMIELNFSCPNVDNYNIDIGAVEWAASHYNVIVKVAPDIFSERTIERCINAGVQHVHLTNTMSVETGGESGGRLKPISLGLVKETRQQYPDASIIGGGGIYDVQDVYDYRDAGANKFSLATAFMIPWRGYKIIKDYYATVVKR